MSKDDDNSFAPTPLTEAKQAPHGANSCDSDAPDSAYLMDGDDSVRRAQVERLLARRSAENLGRSA